MSTDTVEVQELLSIIKFAVISAFDENKLLQRYDSSLERFLDDKTLELFHLLEGQDVSCCAYSEAGINLKLMSDWISTMIDVEQIIRGRRVLQESLHKHNKYTTRNIAKLALDLIAISFLFLYFVRLSPIETDSLETVMSYISYICQAKSVNYFTKDFYGRAITVLQKWNPSKYNVRSADRSVVYYAPVNDTYDFEVGNLTIWKSLVTTETLRLPILSSTQRLWAGSINKPIVLFRQISTHPCWNIEDVIERLSSKVLVPEIKFVRPGSFKYPVNWMSKIPKNFKRKARKKTPQTRSKQDEKERLYPEFVCDGIFVDCIASKNLEHQTSIVIEDKEKIRSTDALNKLLSLKKVVPHDTTEDLIEKMKQTAAHIDEDLAFRYILGYSKIDNVDILHQLLTRAIILKNTNCAKAVAWEITRRFSRTVLISQYHDIWPAFQCVCKTTKALKDKLCSANLSNIVIVVEVNKGMLVVSKIDSFHGIEIIYKEINGHSKEAMYIVEQVEGLEVANTPLSTIKGVISEHAKEYFTNYSKLTMFSKSHLKSKGFGYKNQTFENISCIQLFCRAKGFIPIGESHFPEQISSIQTDILEGYPQLIAQSDIRIGAEIIVPALQANQQSHQQAGNNTEEIIPRDIRRGTIGGFLRYHGEDAFLTCAHVICDWKCLVNGKSGINIHDNPVKIFCPSITSGGKMFQCGQLAGLAFPPDEESGITVDAAIVKIDQALARSYTDTNEKNEMKSKYLHQCCLDWRELGVHNINLEVHAKGSVSLYQKTEYDVKILDQCNVESETLDQACYNVYHNIKPANMTDDIHFLDQAVQTVSQKQSVNPTNIMYLNQIVMQKIKCKPGDSGMCIYVRNPTDGKLWCIGMAVATDPSGGCIITPLKAILKHFNY